MSANRTNQVIQLKLNALTNPFIAKLTMSTDFLKGRYGRRYRNTMETVRATVKSAPEPTTLSLLGFGLITVGFVGVKKAVLSPEK